MKALAWRLLPGLLLACLLTLTARAAEPPLPAWEAIAWKGLPGKNPLAPVANGGTQQTACVTFDVDGDGVQDIVLAERTKAPAIVFLRHTAKGWERRVIEAGHTTPEAGGAACDVDGDGDLDLILGGDWQSDEVWWYENPRPNFDQPWKQHIIKKGGKKQHHDQAVADFKGTGKPQLAFWNQRASKLFLADIPENPRETGPWKLSEVMDTSKVKTAIYQEGLDAFDIDGDGAPDMIAGMYWFKRQADGSFKPTQFSQHPGRVAAGHFKPGKIAQIVQAPGDGNGRLLLFECAGADPTNPKAWTSRDLLGTEVIHGHTLALADVNGDGNLDILCGEMAKWGNKKEADNPGARSWILYGDGQGNFKVTPLTIGIGFHEGRLADVNGDGKIDVIDKPYNWETPQLRIWLNKGNKPGATGFAEKWEGGGQGGSSVNPEARQR